jgi:hypothetical protein
MTTTLVFHEVEDGEVWSKAWRKGPEGRHEMFSKLGISARNFRDPHNHNRTGLILEIPDLAEFQAFLDTDEGKRAMKEDGLKVETLMVLTEFTP